MQFAMPDPAGVGPADPVLRAARGPDPLVEIPPHPHLFRRVRGLKFVSIPGALAPIANCLPISVILGALGHALAVVPGDATKECHAPLLRVI